MTYRYSIARSLVDSFKKGVSVEKALVGVQSVLAKSSLQLLYPHILHTTKLLLEKEKSLETVRIETPFRVDDETKKSIMNLIGVHTGAAVETSINKDLLAGFTVLHNRVLYDGSAKYFINRLQHKV